MDAEARWGRRCYLFGAGGPHCAWPRRIRALQSQPGARHRPARGDCTGCSGIISFGIAGGLAPHLAPGDWVVASGVRSGDDLIATDRPWTQRLLDILPGAVHAEVTGADAVVVTAIEKRDLHQETGAAAVDMEVAHCRKDRGRAPHTLRCMPRHYRSGAPDTAACGNLGPASRRHAGCPRRHSLAPAKARPISRSRAHRERCLYCATRPAVRAPAARRRYGLSLLQRFFVRPRRRLTRHACPGRGTSMDQRTDSAGPISSADLHATIRIATRNEIATSAHWRTAFSSERKDHRYYELIEDTLKGGFDYGYLAHRERWRHPRGPTLYCRRPGSPRRHRWLRARS